MLGHSTTLRAVQMARRCRTISVTASRTRIPIGARAASQHSLGFLQFLGNNNTKEAAAAVNQTTAAINTAAPRHSRGFLSFGTKNAGNALAARTDMAAAINTTAPRHARGFANKNGGNALAARTDMAATIKTAASRHSLAQHKKNAGNASAHSRGFFSFFNNNKKKETTPPTTTTTIAQSETADTAVTEESQEASDARQQIINARFDKLMREFDAEFEDEAQRWMNEFYVTPTPHLWVPALLSLSASPETSPHVLQPSENARVIACFSQVLKQQSAADVGESVDATMQLLSQERGYLSADGVSDGANADANDTEEVDARRARWVFQKLDVALRIVHFAGHERLDYLLTTFAANVLTRVPEGM
jgi:hypothetical protein